MMTLNYFKFVILNYLLCFSASYDPSLGKAYNDSRAAIRGMANSLSLRRHKWQMANGYLVRNMHNYQFHAVLVANMGTDKETYCSGSLVSYRVLITAAICVFDLNQRRYTYYNTTILKVLAGATDGYDIINHITERDVQEVKAIDKYTENTGRLIFEGGKEVIVLKQDLAVVKIKGLFKHEDNVTPIALPTGKSILVRMMELRDTRCIVFGTGTDSYTSDSALLKDVSLKFYIATVNLIPFEKCDQRTRIRGFGLKRKIHVCATGALQSICMGENGGGLMCKVENKWVIMGIISMQFGCGTKTAPMVFTRVDSAKDFIHSFFDQKSNIEKSAQSSGDYIHNQLVAQYYGAPLTSVLLVTHFIKSGF